MGWVVMMVKGGNLIYFVIANKGEPHVKEGLVRHGTLTCTRLWVEL